MKRSEIHPELLQELNELEVKYKKVTEFAERLPLFAENIISGKFTPNMYNRLTSRYKTLPLSWGICWNPHLDLTNRNKPLKPSEAGVVQVYINCCDLFHDDYYNLAKDTLTEKIKSIKVFYFDNLNSTFYFKPDEVEQGLEDLHDWFVLVKDNATEYLKNKRKAELTAELARLESN